MLKHFYFCLVLLLCFNHNVFGQDLVKVPQGLIQGKTLSNDNGKNYTSFQGIPYAKPPVGDLRFKPPEAPEPWNGTLNATQEGNVCVSKHMFTNELDGNEDCLFLNIYVPQNSSAEPMAVFFWIYSGGFIYGSGNTDTNGPNYLMDYDVILVTMNYRVGPLGFLNLELADAPGNMGLMDQVAALKWVNNNIEYFGGDPSRITVGGQASAHYMVLSNMTNGLFQRAIMNSASALTPWAYQKYHLKRAFQLTALVGLNTTDPEEALTFLKQAPASDLYSITMPPEREGQIIEDYIFVPSNEKVFDTHEPFLSETPLSAMISGNYKKVPIMTGFNNGDGIMFYMYVSNDSSTLKELQQDFEQFIPLDLNIVFRSEQSRNLAQQMRDFYFQSTPVPDDLYAFVDIMGDNWNIRSIDKLVKLGVQKSDEPIFYYEYLFAVYPPLKKIFGDYNQTRAAHGAELSNIFTAWYFDLGDHIPSVVLNQKRMLKMWTNFMKFGNPTPEVTELLPVKWEPVSQDSLNYLSINETFSMEIYPERERMEFWENVELQIAYGVL